MSTIERTAAAGGRKANCGGSLQPFIVERRKTKAILVMTHLVIGYPNMEESFQLAVGMAEAGVDILELQIPFSEPMADGPVIVMANEKALLAGVTVDKCFEFMRRLKAMVDIPIVFMSYCNVPMRKGIGAFARLARQAGAVGSIVPDLPPEEGQGYLEESRSQGIDPVLLIAPNTPVERIARINDWGSGMLYLVARKGVTGAETNFSEDLSVYLERVRSATTLPLALGFGLKNRQDIEFLQGKVDVAVVGSAGIHALNEGGVEGALKFIGTLVS